jgi:lysophospholipase L1-like esterase
MSSHTRSVHNSGSRLPVLARGPRRRARFAWIPALACVWACSGSDDNEEGVSPLASERRVATWGTAPQDYNEVFPGGAFPPPEPLSFSNQSLRQIVHISTGGSRPRVRLSNLFSTAPLSIAGAHVALSLGGSSIDTNTDTVLRFAGQTSATVPPGGELWSDPADLVLGTGADLAITLYLAGATPVTTVHGVALQTAHAVPGDALSSAELSGAETSTRYYWITAVDVVRSGRTGAIVAFGDSITDGVGSTENANHRYPNYLAERLRSDPDLEGFGVVNEGISGNRVLNDVAGPRGVSRFGRDVLGHSAASHVIILLGINDIGFSGFAPDMAVSAEQITDGLASMVQEAEAAGLATYLGTLLPLEGTMPPYYSEQSEAVRAAVNAWIRNDAPADGVIDFDLEMQDPAAPLRMLPAYNSGDFLHPGDMGYAAMANAIDLDQL